MALQIQSPLVNGRRFSTTMNGDGEKMEKKVLELLDEGVLGVMFG